METAAGLEAVAAPAAAQACAFLPAARDVHLMLGIFGPADDFRILEPAFDPGCVKTLALV
jgi:hypothetical protein